MQENSTVYFLKAKKILTVLCGKTWDFLIVNVVKNTASTNITTKYGTNNLRKIL